MRAISLSLSLSLYRIYLFFISLSASSASLLYGVPGLLYYIHTGTHHSTGERTAWRWLSVGHNRSRLLCAHLTLGDKNSGRSCPYPRQSKLTTHRPAMSSPISPIINLQHLGLFFFINIFQIVAIKIYLFVAFQQSRLVCIQHFCGVD